MGLGLRVRVQWDDTIIEDRIHERAVVAIGAGEHAQVVASGAPDRYAVLRRRGGGFELRVEPGAATTVEFPGEAPLPVVEPLVRRLVPPFRSARLVMGDSVVELEVIEPPPVERDRALIAWAAAAAVLAAVGGSSYQMVRLLGDGNHARWGRPTELSQGDASRIRVRIGPEGTGSIRPQTGRGTQLRSPATALRTGPDRGAPSTRTIPEVNQSRPGARPARPSTRPLTAAETSARRASLVEKAEAALLEANLRNAVDSFERAAKTGPLDYNELNWLGLAHYLRGEYDESDRAWTQARDLDAARADAINNLASSAKRRGDNARERELLDAALALSPDDCHATNSKALLLAKTGLYAEAQAQLEASDRACGGGYAYTAIQRAAILALQGQSSPAFTALEEGLSHVDTLIPIKAFEVYEDLRLDPAFASLRSDGRFAKLVTRYLPSVTSAAPAPDGDAKSLTLVY